jgi:hypothetical protein
MAPVTMASVSGCGTAFSAAAFLYLNFDTFRLMDTAVTGRERYQRKALDCVREAERLRDAGERTKLLAVAGLYLSLARHVGNRNDRATALRDPELHPTDA